MTDVVRASDVTLHDLVIKFGLILTEEATFFSEWQTALPELTTEEMHSLDQLKQGYFNWIQYPSPVEHMVKLAVVGPLLHLAGFFLHPFEIKTEYSITFTEQDFSVEGKIDVLVLQENIWVIVIESKRAVLSIEAGLAQILTYMLADPTPNKPTYGFITTGGSCVFIKLVKTNSTPLYALSRIFELRNPGNELYTVLAILKKLGWSNP